MMELRDPKQQVLDRGFYITVLILRQLKIIKADDTLLCDQRCTNMRPQGIRVSLCELNQKGPRRQEWFTGDHISGVSIVLPNTGMSERRISESGFAITGGAKNRDAGRTRPDVGKKKTSR